MYRGKRHYTILYTGPSLIKWRFGAVRLLKIYRVKGKCKCEWMHIGAFVCANAYACVYEYALIYGWYHGQ